MNAPWSEIVRERTVRWSVEIAFAFLSVDGCARARARQTRRAASADRGETRGVRPDEKSEDRTFRRRRYGISARVPLKHRTIQPQKTYLICHMLISMLLLSAVDDTEAAVTLHYAHPPAPGAHPPAPH